MSNADHELSELRKTLADDPTLRVKLLAGLGDALDARDAATNGHRAEMIAASEEADAAKRGDLVSGLLSNGALLYSAPTIASRVLVAQCSGSVPQTVIVTALGN